MLKKVRERLLDSVVFFLLALFSVQAFIMLLALVECLRRSRQLPDQAQLPNSTTNGMAFDIGCGAKKVPGTIGADICAVPGVNVQCDITKLPFRDSCAGVIYLNHVLEHVPEVMPFMAGLWRMCKPGALVHIRVPHCSGRYAWIDPTHRRAFTSESFAYFGENEYSYYSTTRFRVKSVRLIYRMVPSRRSLRCFADRRIQWLLDRHPWFTEGIAPYIGGIDEIQATLEAQKEA